MRRLLLLVTSAVLVETAFYAVLTPLLPELAREHDLSKFGAGVLAAAYAAGTFAGAIPTGWLAARIGVRRTVVSGLGLIALSSLAFAFAGSVVVLDATRFAQGVGGAACWVGGLGWIVRAAPADRRGAMIGIVLGAATVGALCGPVLGGVASSIGTEPVFAAVAAVAALLAAWAWFTPGPAPIGSARLGALGAAVRDRRVAAGMWLTLLPGLLYGTIYVLAPLRLDELGVGAGAIAAAFLAAAGLEAVVNPISGRLTDRHGWAVPALAGLAGGTVAMAALPWPASGMLLAGLVVLLSPIIGFLWTPGVALVSDGAEAVDVEPGFAFALSNLAWALGVAVGSSGSAALAQATGDHLPYLGLALVSMASFGVLRRAAGRAIAPAG